MQVCSVDATLLVEDVPEREIATLSKGLGECFDLIRRRGNVA
jgi:hypothetical protein